MIASREKPAVAGHRAGLTIVEMLVSTALIMFIMVILSEAFVAGLDSFRRLKAIGDMNEKLRSAAEILRRDLKAPHFSNADKLSIQSLPPSEGFLRIYQGSQGVSEGSLDGITSYRSTDHALHFSVNFNVLADSRYPGAKYRPENYMRAIASGTPLDGEGETAYQSSGTVVSQWAEIAYFLRPTYVNSEGTQLHGLFRRQLVAGGPRSNGGWPWLDGSGDSDHRYREISSPDLLSSPTTFLSSPMGLTAPVLRFGMSRMPFAERNNSMHPVHAGQFSNGTFYPSFREQYPDQTSIHGGDLLLTDVISFDIRVSYLDGSPPTPTDFTDLFGLTSRNLAFQAAGGPRVFDTWSNLSLLNGSCSYNNQYAASGTYKSMPLMITIKALQITLRIWDPRTKITRQLSIVQDM